MLQIWGGMMKLGNQTVLKDRKTRKTRQEMKLKLETYIFAVTERDREDGWFRELKGGGFGSVQQEAVTPGFTQEWWEGREPWRFTLTGCRRGEGRALSGLGVRLALLSFAEGFLIPSMCLCSPRQ